MRAIRVKLSSEAAEALSLTPVVVQEMPARELIEHILALAGKDETRIREILHRGSLLSGASRFRWSALDPEPAALHELLAEFPDDDPARAFAPANCVRAVLTGPRMPLELARSAGERKGLFQRKTFWAALMETIPAPAYRNYSYRDRADRYQTSVPPEDFEKIRAAADLLQFTSLRDQLRVYTYTGIELFTTR